MHPAVAGLQDAAVVQGQGHAPLRLSSRAAAHKVVAQHELAVFQIQAEIAVFLARLFAVLAGQQVAGVAGHVAGQIEPKLQSISPGICDAGKVLDQSIGGAAGRNINHTIRIARHALVNQFSAQIVQSVGAMRRLQQVQDPVGIRHKGIERVQTGVELDIVAKPVVISVNQVGPGADALFENVAQAVAVIVKLGVGKSRVHQIAIDVQTVGSMRVIRVGTHQVLVEVVQSVAVGVLELLAGGQQAPEMLYLPPVGDAVVIGVIIRLVDDSAGRHKADIGSQLAGCGQVGQIKSGHKGDARCGVVLSGVAHVVEIGVKQQAALGAGLLLVPNQVAVVDDRGAAQGQ